MPEASTPLSPTDELLKVLISIMGRVAVPEGNLRAIVSPQGSTKYVTAYNLCDGRRTLSGVAREVGLDKSNLAKAVARWVDAGVLFRLGTEQALFGLYPVSSVGMSDHPEGEGTHARASNRVRRDRLRSAPEVPASSARERPEGEL